MMNMETVVFIVGKEILIQILLLFFFIVMLKIIFYFI